MTQTAVHILTLGCARNDVDTEELAGRLLRGGFRLADDIEEADVVVVNTCGFIEAAKKDSIDTLLAAAELKESGKSPAIVAVGCLAERYGAELAQAMPEADMILSFDDYPYIEQRLRLLLAGGSVAPHTPRDRRLLLPASPVQRRAASQLVSLPGHGGIVGETPGFIRHRLVAAPAAPVKIASGCDRRCAFCAIPAIRGSFVSRPVADVVTETEWLVDQGVKEITLVSENSSSYGKDWGDLHALESLLRRLSRLPGLEWIRVSYLQPAEVTSSLLDVMTSTDKVMPYFDLSFQHASPRVLRSMRRYGDPDSFLSLLSEIRTRAPRAGVRSNVIVGFPGETDEDIRMLKEFLSLARLDALGVFGYSDEEGTEAAMRSDKLDDDEIAARTDELTDLANALLDARAEERVGEVVDVLIEECDGEASVGRAAHQGPEVDGTTRVTQGPLATSKAPIGIGDVIRARVVGTDGVDLIAVLEEGK